MDVCTVPNAISPQFLVYTTASGRIRLVIKTRPVALPGN